MFTLFERSGFIFGFSGFGRLGFGRLWFGPLGLGVHFRTFGAPWFGVHFRTFVVWKFGPLFGRLEFGDHSRTFGVHFWTFGVFRSFYVRFWDVWSSTPHVQTSNVQKS